MLRLLQQNYFANFVAVVSTIIAIAPYVAFLYKGADKNAPFYENSIFSLCAISVAIVSLAWNFYDQLRSEKEKNAILKNIETLNVECENSIDRSNVLLKQTNESRQSIYLLEGQNHILSHKLEQMTKIISSFYISYSVHFNTVNSKKIYSPSELLSASPLVYAQFGTNIYLKSIGVSYRFGESYNGGFFVECNARLINNEYPMTFDTDTLNSEIYKNMTLYIPLYKASPEDDSILVSNLSASITINGIVLSPIIKRFNDQSFPITDGVYEDSTRKVWGEVKVTQNETLYEMYERAKKQLWFIPPSKVDV